MRDNNFTKKQIRGIDIAISAAKKTYPFIEGWEFSNGYEYYETTLYIILLVDFNKISKLFGREIAKYHKTEMEKNPDKIYSTPIAVLEDNFEFGSEEWDKNITKNVEYSLEIKRLVSKLYKHLPQEYIIYYNTNLFPEIQHETDLGVDGYKMYRS